MAAKSQDSIVEGVNLRDEEKKLDAAIKYGLAAPYLDKFPFEDREDVPNSEFYDTSDDEEDYRGPRKPRPANAFELVKRFLKQVRESYGYDLDCSPPPSFGSPFIPKRVDKLSESFRDYAMGATHFAIKQINSQMEKVMCY